MIRVTAFAHHDPADAERVLAIARDGGAEQVAATRPGNVGGGQTMIFGVFDDVEAARSFTRRLTLPLSGRTSRVEVVTYSQGAVRLQEPEITGIQRTLLLRVHDGVDPVQVATFERQLADMGSYISEIRNSSLSQVDEVVNGIGPAWTHVWEQEFRSLDDLTGPYMNHAYHFGYIDTWFDPQAPNHVVDTTLVHAMCTLERSILGRAEMAPS